MIIIKDFLTGSLRNQIGLVQQDNIFLRYSERKYLTRSPDATEEEVIEVLKWQMRMNL